MNGIDKITQRIGADTQAEIDRILADAAAQAEAEMPGEKSGAPEEPAAQREEAPARHLDFKGLEHHFGKDYEIK